MPSLMNRIKGRIRRTFERARRALSERGLSLPDRFHSALIEHSQNYGKTLWLGNPIWQNVLDLWVIQETIAEVRPALLIETGTNRGGSSLFYANLFDLMGFGRIVTIDIAKLHELTHPRIDYLLGDSSSSEVVARVRDIQANHPGPVMVILDSDHSESHVTREMNAYAPFVTPGSYMLVQDGVIDRLPRFADARPGPLPAIEKFLLGHHEFELDAERCNRFLLSHHPKGWLRRKPVA
jgi:cephalosporin hydroxylase